MLALAGLLPFCCLLYTSDPFFTTKEVGRGTGQGLAITRSIIVDKHAGDVSVKSTVGVGSEFTLRLPIGGGAAPAT